MGWYAGVAQGMRQRDLEIEPPAHPDALDVEIRLGQPCLALHRGIALAHLW